MMVFLGNIPFLHSPSPKTIHTFDEATQSMKKIDEEIASIRLNWNLDRPQFFTTKLQERSVKVLFEELVAASNFFSSQKKVAEETKDKALAARMQSFCDDLELINKIHDAAQYLLWSKKGMRWGGFLLGTCWPLMLFADKMGSTDWKLEGLFGSIAGGCLLYLGACGQIGFYSTLKDLLKTHDLTQIVREMTQRANELSQNTSFSALEISTEKEENGFAKLDQHIEAIRQLINLNEITFSATNEQKQAVNSLFTEILFLRKIVDAKKQEDEQSKNKNLSNLLSLVSDELDLAEKIFALAHSILLMRSCAGFGAVLSTICLPIVAVCRRLELKTKWVRQNEAALMVGILLFVAATISQPSNNKACRNVLKFQDLNRKVRLLAIKIDALNGSSQKKEEATFSPSGK